MKSTFRAFQKYHMFGGFEALSLVFKILGSNVTFSWKMIIICNDHLNSTHFLIVCHKSTSQENVMGFQIKI